MSKIQQREPDNIRRIHYISISTIMFLISTSINLFQNFIFNEISKKDGVTMRYNVGLQTFSVLNFFGSFFWTFLADKKRNHQIILLFNCVIYGVLALFLFLINGLRSVQLKLTAILIITVFREFTLGGFTSIVYALVMNYCTGFDYDSSLLGIVNICFNFGIAFAMFLNYLIALIAIKYKTQCIFLFFSFFVCIIGKLLYSFTPKYTIMENDNIEDTNEENVVKLFKKPSMILLYLVVVVSGIFKCVSSNFAITYYEIVIDNEFFVKILMLCRYLAEGTILLILSYSEIPIFFSFTFSLLISGISLFLDLRFVQFHRIFILSEILRGIGRSSFLFSSILIFKEYDTPKTVTQIQGIRNGAYNGLSCVLIGLIGYLFIPKDLVDYRSLSSSDSLVMKKRQINFFRQMLGNLMYLLFGTIALALLAKYFFFKNR